jgi:alpha-1,6-mannosyltransferase
LKIVDVADFYTDNGGGVRTYTNHKLKAGAAAGHEVVVIAPGIHDSEEVRYGGRVVWVKGPTLPAETRYRVLHRTQAVHEILDREAPDLVEASSPYAAAWAVSRWKGNAAKVFLYHEDTVAVMSQVLLGPNLGTMVGDRLFSWVWSYLRGFTSRFDATVVAGPRLADRLRHFGVRRPESVPFGIDKSFLSPSRRNPGLRSRLLAECGAPGNASLLVVVGRLHPEKRLRTILKGFELASRRRPLGLVIYGDGWQRGWVERRAAKLPGVKVAGFTSDRDLLTDAMASCDALLHGSSTETYGLAVAEAICSGLPVVVPDAGGAGELAGPRYSETYRPGDAEDCADALCRLLERDRDSLRSGCAQAARDRVRTLDEHFADLFGLYARLIEERQNHKPPARAAPDIS